MKTLVVSYLPRGERSHTSKLLDGFLHNVDHDTIDYLDLLEETPDLMDAQRVIAYIRRNYLGEELAEADAASLARLDKMTEQFLAADAVVLAFPMHNFSFPAIVKAYFDGIMQKGKTWDAAEGGYVGLQPDKKALVLLASGGVYDGDFAPYEHAISLARAELGFMGIKDIQTVTAAGMNLLPPDQIKAVQAKALAEVQAIAAAW